MSITRKEPSGSWPMRGYPDGFKTTIHAARQEQDWNIVQIATGYLREIGIEAEIIEMEWGDFWTMISETRAGYELHYGWAAVNIDPLLWATLQFDPQNHLLLHL